MKYFLTCGRYFSKKNLSNKNVNRHIEIQKMLRKLTPCHINKNMKDRMLDLNLLARPPIGRYMFLRLKNPK